MQKSQSSKKPEILIRTQKILVTLNKFPKCVFEIIARNIFLQWLSFALFEKY